MKKILNIIEITCIIGIVFFLYLIYTNIKESNSSIKSNEKIIENFIEEETEINSQGKKVIKEIFNWDMNKLLKITPLGVGYIRQGNGEYINNPIIRGDDNEYYLKHTITGEYDKIGSIFMDYRNVDGFNSRNTIIYGHNMSERVNHIMFGSLNWYWNDWDYYKAHPYFDIYTEEGCFKYYVYSVFKISMNDTEPYTVNFATDEDFINYVEKYRKKSCYKIDDVPEITKDMKIITLSTCASDNRKNRLLVQLVRLD